MRRFLLSAEDAFLQPFQHLFQRIRGFPQLLLFLLAQRNGNSCFNAVLSYDGGHAQDHIRNSVFPVHHGGYGKDGFFIPDDGLADPFHGHGDAVIGGVLFGDDLIGAVLYLLRDPAGRGLMLEVAAHLAETV